MSGLQPCLYEDFYSVSTRKLHVTAEWSQNLGQQSKPISSVMRIKYHIPVCSHLFSHNRQNLWYKSLRKVQIKTATNIISLTLLSINFSVYLNYNFSICRRNVDCINILQLRLRRLQIGQQPAGCETFNRGPMSSGRTTVDDRLSTPHEQ
jgi:uncharacterized protein (DUF486 family)